MVYKIYNFHTGYILMEEGLCVCDFLCAMIHDREIYYIVKYNKEEITFKHGEYKVYESTHDYETDTAPTHYLEVPINRLVGLCLDVPYTYDHYYMMTDNGLVKEESKNLRCSYDYEAKIWHHAYPIYRTREEFFIHNDYKVKDNDGNTIWVKCPAEKAKLNPTQAHLVSEFINLMKKMEQEKIAMLYDGCYSRMLFANEEGATVDFEEMDNETPTKVSIDSVGVECPVPFTYTVDIDDYSLFLKYE